nr:MAG TPA: hypothetical protein [Caudoviricetes sp.]
MLVYYIKQKGVPIMDQYRLQMLQWKQTNGFVLTKEE